MTTSILVVEDDEDIRETLVSVLENEGYDVLSASNGAAALQALRATEELPMLILLDLMMPVMSGQEFRVEQRNDARIADIPVVILSGDPTATSRSGELRAWSYLRKPVTTQELLAAVHRCEAAHT